MRASTRTSRIAAYVASGALVVSGTVLAATPAEAVTYDPQPANQAATWLDGELEDGLMHNPNFGGFDDYGLTVDTGLALEAVGGHSAAVQDIKDALADHVDDYVTPFGGPHSYTGGLAKLAAFVGHPAATTFGGQNLVTQLEARVASEAPITGRIEDTGYTPGSQFDDDSANVYGQAYAAHALANAGSTKKAAVTAFLLKQQCPNGGFRLDFTKSKTAAGQSCTSNASAQTDATAIALLQLASQSGSGSVADAITRGETWLRSLQRCDGSFGGGTSTEASNANSTGLVAWALGDSPASRQAAGWLRKHQATAQDSGNSLASETGAIAYNDDGLAAGRTEGITEAKEDEWRRATSQAAPGIRWFSSDATPAINLSGPANYRKQGTRHVLRTTGAAEGTVLCVTGPSASKRGFATETGWNSTVTLPAGTGTRTYTVRDSFGNSSAAAVKVLGKKTLPIYKTKSRVKRSGWITARIGGLASRESAKIWYKGNVIRSGRATTRGVFSASFKVGRSLGQKSIVGHGKFGDIRRGATTIRVVR